MEEEEELLSVCSAVALCFGCGQMKAVIPFKRKESFYSVCVFRISWPS